MRNRCWKLFRKKLRKIFLFERYIICKTKADINSLSKVPERYFFREAKIEDVQEVIQTFHPHYTDKDYDALKKRIRSGEHLILGYFREKLDRLCMFSWMSEIDPFFLEEKKINQISGAICNCRVFVLDSYRNLGMSRYSMLYLVHWAAFHQYSEVVSYIRTNNVAQLKAVEHASWKYGGWLYRIIFLGNEIIRIKLIG
jgi:hypothetical protein